MMSDEENGDKTFEVDERIENVEDVDDDDDAVVEKRSSQNPARRCNFKTFCVCTVSTLLFVLFVYALAVQYNDPDKYIWCAYYGFQAVIPAIFIIFYLCPQLRYVDKAIYFLCSGMIVWSIVFIVMISLELGKLDPEGYEETKREELIFEISGNSIGLLADIYHAILTYRIMRIRGNHAKETNLYQGMKGRSPSVREDNTT